MRLPFFPWSIAGVPSSQALPGFLITAPPPVLVPAVLGALAVWIQNQKTKKKLYDNSINDHNNDNHSNQWFRLIKDSHLPQETGKET